jgi:hypothetical protein
MADQTPKPKPRRPSLPAPDGPTVNYGRRVYGRRVYGKAQKRANATVTVMVTLRSDSAGAVLKLARKHRLSRAGAAHHLIRLGAGLKPLPPLD